MFGCKRGNNAQPQWHVTGTGIIRKAEPVLVYGIYQKQFSLLFFGHFYSRILVPVAILVNTFNPEGRISFYIFWRCCIGI
ncbi:MAG TPA: hypothetical protein DF409_01595 [Bacteroidales bacterium]|jgi:hypothetical protein|nr:hypothetical protein [Bacteroidales bacterium]